MGTTRTWPAAGVAALVVAATLTVGASARADDGGGNGDDGALSGRLQYIADLPDGGDVADQIAAASDVLGTAPEGPGSIAESGGRISVTVTFAQRPDAAALDALRTYGEVTAASELFSMATVRVAPSDLQALAAVPGVSSVREDIVPRTSGSWAATTAGAATTAPAAVPAAGAADDCRSIPANLVAPLNVAAARDAFGVDGTGVTVGIISDSYARLPNAQTQIADSVAHGLLPGLGSPCGYETPVEVLRESTISGGDGDEGRAMAQLVHQIAPGARLMFATAGASPLEYADSIAALADAGADVIVDDVMGNEPWFQDGPISWQVQQVTDRGIPYLAAAGNMTAIGGAGQPSAGYSISGWETAAYRPADCPQAVQDEFASDGITEISCMDFDPGAGVDTLDQMVSTAVPGPNARPTSFDLQWAEPYGAATTDIRFGTIAPDGDVAITLASAPGIPSLSVSVGLDSGAYQFFIVRVGPGDSTPRIRTWFYSRDIVDVEYFRSAGDDVIGHTLSGHEGAPQTIAVGAASAQDASKPETFTSAGPSSYWFDWDPTVSPIATARETPIVTEGPVITGVDRGYTDFFGTEISAGLYSFAGTSAAAPSAAAVVALGLQRNPDATPDQVRAALSSTATPLPSISPVSLTPEQIAGAGLVDAKAFVGALASAPEPGPVPVPASVPTAQSPQLAATGAGEMPLLALLALGMASLGLGVVVRRRGKGRHS